tara:strand:+ start:227 stop:1456 length:1230 start_codon:yes stop_codon:yes gene_type:complete
MKKISVIGAGIVGVCIAYFLNKNGHKVTIFDENKPGTQTSFGNAGIFANHDCVFANSPNLWKDLPSLIFKKDGYVTFDWIYVLTHLPWMFKFLRNCTNTKVNHIAKSLSDFSFHAESAYDELFDEVDVSNYVVNKDSIYLYETEKDFQKGQYMNNLRKKNGVPFDIIDKEKISKLEPSLAPVYYNGVIYRDESYTKSSLKITQSIFNKFINNGGSFILKKIDSVFKKNNNLILKSNNQEFQTDKVIIAAGVWSNNLAKTIKDNFPLDTERGYHITFKSKKNLISRSIGWASAGFYMTPMEDGIRAAGTVEIAGLKKPMNKKRLELIEKTSRKILPQLGEIKNYWMGFRPTLPDSLPVIGKSKKCEDVYYAFGHQHLGLSLGAVTGKVIQSLVEDKRSNINLEPFNPYRF